MRCSKCECAKNCNKQLIKGFGSAKPKLVIIKDIPAPSEDNPESKREGMIPALKAALGVDIKDTYIGRS